MGNELRSLHRQRRWLQLASGYNGPALARLTPACRSARKPAASTSHMTSRRRIALDVEPASGKRPHLVVVDRAAE